MAKASWGIERFDAHWGGWRAVRTDWLSETPARYATKAEAEAVVAKIKRNRPWVRLRVKENT